MRTFKEKARILIEQTGTGLFYAHPDKWLAARGEATDYESSLKASIACKHLHFADVCILLDFGESSYDVRLRQS